MNNLKKIYEKQDLLSKLVDSKEIFQHYRLSEIHCIDLIGKIDNANVTALAESLNMTKGAISKMTRRLAEQGVITKYQKEDNKKEIYFKLTELGKELYIEHEKLHQCSEERDREFFKKLSEQEKDAAIKFLEMFNDYLENKIKELSIDED